MNRKQESLLREYLRLQILSEKKWSDKEANKGQVVDLEQSDFEVEDADDPEEIRNQVFKLIQNAYKDVEIEPGVYGNAKVSKPEDLPAGYTVMSAADIDDDPEIDYFRGGKMKNGRYKMGIVGHDGSKKAINTYLEKSAEQLKSGAIAEMSGKIAHIMITRYGVPAVTDKEEVEKMLGKKVEWQGRHPIEKYAERYGKDYEGFYYRTIGGKPHMKILLGGS